jgi:hypothetical protein
MTTPNPGLPAYIRRQWNDLTLDERREWVEWLHQEGYKAEERLCIRKHEQPCECSNCRAFRARLRKRRVRDGEPKREPKPKGWKNGR